MFHCRSLASHIAFAWCCHPPLGKAKQGNIFMKYVSYYQDEIIKLNELQKQLFLIFFDISMNFWNMIIDFDNSINEIDKNFWIDTINEIKLYCDWQDIPNYIFMSIIEQYYSLKEKGIISYSKTENFRIGILRDDIIDFFNDTDLLFQLNPNTISIAILLKDNEWIFRQRILKDAAYYKSRNRQKKIFSNKKLAAKNLIIGK
jgi:hypothetical protein